MGFSFLDWMSSYVVDKAMQDLVCGGISIDIVIMMAFGWPSCSHGIANLEKLPKRWRFFMAKTMM